MTAVPADALTPVRDALLSTAAERAHAVRSSADAAAAALLARARQEAADLLAQARQRGEADAAAARASTLAAAGRQARTETLGARRAALERLRADVRAEVARIADDPGYARLRAGLVDAVRRTLGPDAVVRDARGGGVTGEVPGRRVDYSLAAFADRASDTVAGALFGPEPAGALP